VKRHFLITIAALLLVRAWGQDTHTMPAPAISPEIAYTEILVPPMPVSGLRMPLTFSSETPRSNFVMGSLQVGSAYDDNALTTPSHHIGDVSYMILPSIRIGQTRELWNWDFDYSPGFTINQRIVERNQAAHDLHMLFAYRVSPHVTAQIRESFEKTNSLFSGFLGGASTPVPGPLQQSNTSVIVPLANRTGNNSGLDLTYQFSANSLLGASGNFYFVNYDVPPGSAPTTSGLIDSRAWGGNAFYAHRFSNRHWIGVTESFQRLLFDPGYRTDVNRTMLFYSVSTGPSLTFSVWVGPEQSRSVIPKFQVVNSATGSEVHWRVAGGCDLTWQGRRTSFGLGYIRQTSDGGGLAGAVVLQQVNGEMRQRLAARWTASLGLGYAKNQPLNAVNGQTPYHTFLGNVGLDWSLTDNVALGLHYGHDQLTYEPLASSRILANSNRAFFSVSYSFSRPVGR
jgi:hypothetical protein